MDTWMSLTAEHEGLIELFKSRPELGPMFLQQLGGAATKRGTTFEVQDVELTQLVPAEFEADLVIAFKRRNQLDGALIVEVQRSKDAKKRLSWPQYITALRARLDCPVSLLIVAPSEAIAKWCQKPIELGHGGFCLKPYVLGPKEVPVLKDRKSAKSIELAVLSAVVHGRERQNAREVAICALEMADQVQDDRLQIIYYNLVLGALSGPLQKAIEAMVLGGKIQLHGDITKKHYERGHEEGLEKGRGEGLEEGELKGRAELVLKQLEIKFKKAVTKKIQTKVRKATIEQLDRYAERVLTENTLEAVLEND